MCCPPGRVLDSLRGSLSSRAKPYPSARLPGAVSAPAPRPARAGQPGSPAAGPPCGVPARPPSPRGPPLHPPRAAVGRAPRPPPPARSAAAPARGAAGSVLGGARGWRLDSARLRPWPWACAASGAAASGYSWVSRRGSRLRLRTRPRAGGASLRGRGGFGGVAGERGAGTQVPKETVTALVAPWPPAPGCGRFHVPESEPRTIYLENWLKLKI